MNLRTNEPLCLHTTFRVGGPARFFLEPKTDDEIQEAVTFANLRALPVFVLGSGTNVLASDAGFDGVIIKVATRGIQAKAMSGERVEVLAESGEEWDALVAFAVAQGFYGMENMSLIPGTVGAAVAGNIGAYGAEVKETLLWAETVDRRTGRVRRFAGSECAFAYRRSFFKTPEGRNFIVTRAAFALKRTGRLNTSYQDLQAYLAAQPVTAPTLAQVREAVIAIRQRKLPDPSVVGTAGSFFKNPVIARTEYQLLATDYPGLPGHDEGNGLVKVPLGWVLDKVCGFKGIRRGRVGTHSEQALVIVNEGGSAAEIEAFAHEVARTVKEKTGIMIEWEVEKVGLE